MDKKKIVSLIVVIIAIAVTIAAVFFGNMLKSKHAELTDRTKEIILANKKFVELRSQSQILSNNQATSQEDIINAYFIEEDEVVTLIEEIEGFDEYTDTSTVLKNIDEIQNKDTGRTELRMRVTSVGDFESTMNLLRLLQNMPYEVAFDNVSLIQKVVEREEDVPLTIAIPWTLEADLILYTFRPN